VTIGAEMVVIAIEKVTIFVEEAKTIRSADVGL
jgi:hypothetical protein